MLCIFTVASATAQRAPRHLVVLFASAYTQLHPNGQTVLGTGREPARRPFSALVLHLYGRPV
jgi:hypothetical protein